MTPQGTRRATEPDPGSPSRPRAAAPSPTGATSAAPAAGDSGPRMLQPIRWPKPERGVVRLVAVYLVGVLVAVVPPAFIVPPSSDTADTVPVVIAFALTAVGVAVMVAATVALYRREREVGHLVLAVVPTGVLLAGGLMLMATKLFL